MLCGRLLVSAFNGAQATIVCQTRASFYQSFCCVVDDSFIRRAKGFNRADLDELMVFTTAGAPVLTPEILRIISAKLWKKC